MAGVPEEPGGVAGGIHGCSPQGRVHLECRRIIKERELATDSPVALFDPDGHGCGVQKGLF